MHFRIAMEDKKNILLMYLHHGQALWGGDGSSMRFRLARDSFRDTNQLGSHDERQQRLLIADKHWSSLVEIEVY